MGNLRDNAKAAKIIASAGKITDLKKAFALLATLAGKPLQEEHVEVGYSQKNGQPNKWKWVPYKPSEWPEVHISFGWPGRLGKTSLAKAILKKFPEGRVAVVKNGNKDIVIEHVRKYSERDGTVPNYISIREATTL